MQKSNYIRYGLMLIFGNVLLAIASTLFFIPLNIVNGGMNGLAIVFFEWFAIPIEWTTAFLAWGFFLLGLVLLGKSFTMKTLVATVVYPVTVIILLWYIPQNSLGFDPSDSTHILLASMFGGSLMGIGIAFTFLAGGSTGGFDVLMLLGKKYFAWKPSIVSLMIDVIIIGLGMLTFGFITGLYGIISTIITSLMIELIFVGFSQVYLVTIISSKPQEINRYITEVMERGSTIFPARGGYSQQSLEVIQVAISRREYFSLKQTISEVDPQAFVIFTQARSIHGLGFETLAPLPKGPFKKRKNERE